MMGRPLRDPRTVAVLVEAAMMPKHSPVAPLALFRTLAQNLDLCERLAVLGRYLLRDQDAALPPAARELVILRVCAQCRCAYEWGVHVASFGDRVGLSAAQLAAIWHEDATSTLWDDEQRAIIRMVDELHTNGDISDDVWAALRPRWTNEQLLELLVVAGWYHAISFVANVARVTQESWAPRP